MDALVRGNKLQTRQDIADFLGYTVKVSELFEVYDTASVMLYDNQYRMNQHRHGFRWGRDSEQLLSRFLRSQAPLPSRTTLGHRKPGTDRAKTAERQEICRNFQNPRGYNNLSPAECDNYKSAPDPTTREKVEMQLRNELAKGNYERCREKPTIVSALGAIPKADSADSIDDAVSMLADGSYMAKIDLKSAYRSVPIHPSKYSATGLKWRFQGDSAERVSMAETGFMFTGKRMNPTCVTAT
ncbi:amiloride-sensitive sodium channel [Branchiostoma belcheri]|nr:amiloride-sensitive sodium channel [Branchiostoma belcheri]